MKINLFFYLFLLPFLTFAQVGVNTISPTAELEIATNPTGIPALELNPQTAPVGTANGQISVIGDELYLYDSARGKWLSTSGILLNFGLESNVDGQFLEYAGDVLLTGPRMPKDGTIVYVTINASGGQANKAYQLFRNGTAVPNNDANPSIDGIIQANGTTFTNTAYNLNFNAGDFIRVNVASEGNAVVNPVVLLWVKWRK